MIRLGISAEGATEREFVNRVLRPHLMPFAVHATAMQSERIAHVSMLGSHSWKP